MTKKKKKKENEEGERGQTIFEVQLQKSHELTMQW
jgi:hypothetical protein